jgi:hypothetical protein
MQEQLSNRHFNEHHRAKIYTAQDRTGVANKYIFHFFLWFTALDWYDSDITIYMYVLKHIT